MREMCGITGIFDRSGRLPDAALSERVRAMANVLTHRGPDGSGVFAEQGMALGHCRLAILDLSKEGEQPMVSAGGRFVLVLNGEIYNHLELKAELSGVQWRGHSDTEVLLAALVAWGVERTLERVTGMFAFALWDRKERMLILARDRMGEKPLYYGWSGGSFVFASEPSAFRADPDFEHRVDRQALGAYLRLSCVPAPLSIYEGVRKLQPGTWMALRQDGRDTPPTPYWSLADTIAGVEPFQGSEADALDRLEELLNRAVGNQMLSDVPLGSLLSGGIDSSLVTAMMCQASVDKVRTFTIGYDDKAYDESEDARKVAAHLGTDHTELTLTPAQALAAVGKLAGVYAEPFADASQLPTYLVSSLTREHVTVCLTGDGGDEMFAGYNRHFLGREAFERMCAIPGPLRSLLRGLILALPPRGIDWLFRVLGPILPCRARQRTPGYKLHKLAETLSCKDHRAFYQKLISAWPDPAALLVKGEEPEYAWQAESGIADMTRWMQYMDSVGYLPDDILAKVDRASMAVSLETRAPYLDHEVAEFAWSLPVNMLVEKGRGKLILRKLLARHVPEALFERPKMGFGVPIGNWLKGPLKDWAEDLLDERRLKDEGYLKPGPVRAAFKRHQSGKRDEEYRLWTVLMFQAWLEKWG